MDDLTARALQNQNNANANYNRKQKREAAQTTLTEAPAFITGFEGGKYTIERLGQDPVTGGVPVTNGLLEVGRRVATTGQYVDGMPRVKPVVPAAPLSPAAKGKIKYLYSIVNGSTRELYVGGYQKKAELIGTYPAYALIGTNPAYTLDSTLYLASIDNLGGDRCEINTIIVSGSGGTTTYPNNSITFDYGYDDMSFVKNGVVQSAFRFSIFLNTGNNDLPLGFGFYNTGVYTYFFDGMDMQRAIPHIPSTYSRAYFNGYRFVGSANLTFFGESGNIFPGFWDYFALPRNGTPLVLRNINQSNNGAFSRYFTQRINQTGDRGIGVLNFGIEGSDSLKPVWFDDAGAHTVDDSVFDTIALNAFFSDNYFDLDANAERFYTFRKTALDITQNQALTVETYDRTFTKIGQTIVPTFKASATGNGLIIHQASYHP